MSMNPEEYKQMWREIIATPGGIDRLRRYLCSAKASTANGTKFGELNAKQQAFHDWAIQQIPPEEEIVHKTNFLGDRIDY